MAFAMSDNPNFSDRSDRSLLGHLALGNSDAAGAFYSRHSPRLLAVARQRLSTVLSARLDAEDIVQSTFKSFFRRASTVGYVAPESGELFNLLIVIAMRKVNARADYHFAANRDVRKTVASDSMDIPDRGDEQRLSDLYLTIEEIFCRMTAIQQQIASLRLEGYSVEEISQACQRSKRTVERELQSFRQELSKLLAP
jgi:RNA polymerase sigma-70 factor, ECF subfamily